MNIISKRKEDTNDIEAKSLFKKPCHDNGPGTSDRKIQHDTRAYRRCPGALDARELIKINVLKNCADDPRAIAEMLAERTHSQVVQVIGKKIVLYKEGKNEKKKIELPR